MHGVFCTHTYFRFSSLPGETPSARSLSVLSQSMTQGISLLKSGTAFVDARSKRVALA